MFVTLLSNIEEVDVISTAEFGDCSASNADSAFMIF